MNRSHGRYSLITVFVIAMATAIAHLSCIYLGPECYTAQMAPEVIVESAVNGTLLAPLGTMLVSGLFILAGLYALSAAHIAVNLPMTTPASYTISALCIIRGLLGIQLAIRRPELMDVNSTLASVAWFMCGVLFIIGYRLCKKENI